MPSISSRLDIGGRRHFSRAERRRLRRREAQQHQARGSRSEETYPSRTPRGTRKTAQVVSPAADAGHLVGHWDGDASEYEYDKDLPEDNPPRLAFEDKFWGEEDDLDDSGLHDFVYCRG